MAKILAGPLTDLHNELRAEWAKVIKPGLEAKKKILSSKLRRIEKDYETEESEDLEFEMVKVQTELEQIQAKLEAPHLYLENVTVERLAGLLPLSNEQMSYFSSDAGAAIQNVLGKYNKDSRPDGKQKELLAPIIEEAKDRDTEKFANLIYERSGCATMRELLRLKLSEEQIQEIIELYDGRYVISEHENSNKTVTKYIHHKNIGEPHLYYGLYANSRDKHLRFCPKGAVIDHEKTEAVKRQVLTTKQDDDDEIL